MRNGEVQRLAFKMMESGFATLRGKVDNQSNLLKDMRKKAGLENVFNVDILIAVNCHLINPRPTLFWPSSSFGKEWVIKSRKLCVRIPPRSKIFRYSSCHMLST